MAKFDFDLSAFTKLIKEMDNFDDIAQEALEEAVPELEKTVKSKASQYSDTGAMVGSIKSTKPKKVNDGYIVTVRPTGKDSKGVRNMEKLVYHEYGTSKQQKQPILGPAVAAAEKTIEEKLQKVYERNIK